MVVGCSGSTNEPPLPADTPDVVVVVVDTLRADSTIRAATPGFDDLATNGLRVPYAWSPSTWTAPSTLSLMTGSHVREHGWDLPFPRFMAEAGVSYPSIDDRTTLAEVLNKRGYKTIGYFSNPLLSRELGWQRGFDTWTQTSDNRIVRSVRKSLRAANTLDPDRPIFAYLHLLGPHQPIRPSQPSSRRWGVTSETRYLTRKGIRIEHAYQGRGVHRDQYHRAYHAQIEDTDSLVTELLDLFRRRERPLLVIVTSDHGELLGEHGLWGHEESVWNQLTHVPLIISGDGAIPIPEVVSTAVIPDYITTALHIDHEWPVELTDPPILVSQRDGAIAVSADGIVRGIYDTDGTTLLSVYDVRADPEESNPLLGFGTRAEVQLTTARWMVDTPNHTRAVVNEALDGETRSLLEELGYMGHDEPGDPSTDQEDEDDLSEEPDEDGLGD